MCVCRVRPGVHFKMMGRASFSIMRSCDRILELLTHSRVWSEHRLITMASTVMSDRLIFRQMFESSSSTYTYLVADKDTKEAFLVDPVLESVDRDLRVIQELGLELKYGVNTHVHADHVTGTGRVKQRVPGCKSVISKVSEAQADVKCVEGDVIECGAFKLKCLSTPGHTNGCMSYVLQLPGTRDGLVFTGDALLIRGCGRTDFQQGNAGLLFDSIHKKLFSLPDRYLVYPAHDYKGYTVSTIAEEKLHNPRLTKSRDDFIKLMGDLNLSYPKQMDKAVPANMCCGFNS